MASFTDGKKKVRIDMYYGKIAKENEVSDDFFEVGGLGQMDDDGCYRVRDVDYLIEQATDWENLQGDYADDDPVDRGRRHVKLYDLY